MTSPSRAEPAGRPSVFDMGRSAFHNPALTRRALHGVGRVCVPFGVCSVRALMERSAPSDETDLSAEKAAPRQGTRLPSPDEDNRGTPGSGRPSRPRTQAAGGLKTDRGHNPPRVVMLSRPEDFAALQGEGTVRSHPLLVVRCHKTGLEATRFGLSAGRRLGGAVVRNRARRRLREALRVMAPSFQPGWDVLIIARPPLLAADHGTLMETLEKLLRRGGILGERTAP